MQGINLIGFLKGGFGLGVTTRVMAKMLIRQGIPFCIIDVTDLLSPETIALDEDFNEFAEYFSDSPIYDVNLIISGLGFYSYFFSKIAKKIKIEDKFNVLMLFLEIYEFSEVFLELKHKFQMFIAPTRFIQYVLMRQIDNAYIEYMPPPLFIDASVKRTLLMDKRKIKNEKFTFYYNFDINSSIDRKNPYVLIRSFLDEFGHDDSVQLVLKVIGTFAHKNKELVNALRKLSAGKNIQLIFDYLPYDQNLKLMASADCYVSPHRSEGLGNGLFEAMQLGVPCIATAFGGNADFMNHNNSILIKYDLDNITAKEFTGLLGDKKDYWANPTHLELMFAMRKVREDAMLREKMIKNAMRETNELQEKFLESSVFEAIFTKFQYEKTKQAFYLE